jgi:16S rRNA (cytosine967-C5)-methyltransferase
LADLILGTSVMRLRHWFVLDQQRKHKQKALEPIVGAEPWMVATTGVSGSDTPPPENSTDTTSTRMGIARELVRLHAENLSLGTNNARTTDAVKWPTDTIRRISTQYSLPSFIVRFFVDQYGPEEAEMLLQLANRPGPITLRRNAIRCDSDEILIQRLWEEDEIKAFAPAGAPSGCIRLEYNGESSASVRPSKSLWSTQAWRDGWFEVQDLGSQFIVDSVDVGGGDRTVVDFCAGNGGKTLALASRMWETRQEQRAGGFSQEAGTIIAHDIVGSRLKQIEGSLARAGLGDDIPNNCLPKIQTTSDATSIGTEVADAVLVDAPCSSLGILRRRPGHRWALTEDMITREFPSLQLDILTRASQLVKPGGKLIYATCSVSRFENESVVDMFQSRERYDDDWITWQFDDNGSHFRSILPHVDGCDGFFVARWKRRDRIS